MAVGLLAFHAVVGVAILATHRRLGRKAFAAAAVAPLATLVWLGTQLPHITSGGAHTEHIAWMPALGLGFDVRLDGFAAVMVLLVSGIGLLVFGYASQYLPADGTGVGRLAGLLTLFSGAMLGLVLADNILVIYGFWELTSVTSFLLIGDEHRRPEARAAALHALLVTGTGALAMLGGFLLLGQAAGTYRLSAIVAAPPSGGTVAAALALILVGAFTKSAQCPFHAWLPGAMVASTPVSAYLHSATMVKAGVYLIARLSPAFAAGVGWWRPAVIGVGLLTMIWGGLRALRQRDLKVLLAYGTVSQLGFMVAVFGIGTPEAAAAGIVLLVAHGAFKAAAFMAVGIFDHQFGTRDLRRLPRAHRGWETTVAVVVVSAASMAGLPLMLGFVAKEAVLSAFLDAGRGVWLVAVGGAAAGSVLTVAYSARFAWGALGYGADVPAVPHGEARRPRASLVAPALVLAGVTVGFGLVPGLLDAVVGGGRRALVAGASVHLGVWHGVTSALVVSAAVIALGAAVFVVQSRTPASGRPYRWLPDAGDVYAATLRGLNGLATRVTSVSQPGALPVYAGVILATAAVVPLWALTTGAAWPGWPEMIDSPAHLPVAVVLIGSAIAAAAVRRRFSAALFLGVTGYAMAALFVVQGAPDLALTQVAIETLSTVLFVLVLRRLPDRFGWAGSDRTDAAQRPSDTPTVAVAAPGARPRPRYRALRVAVALAVGVSVFVLAIVMSGPKPSTTTSQQMVERAEPDGHGHNVVNVILVDFRGLDTLGEIAVLASAAIGTVALARAGRRPRRRRPRGEVHAISSLRLPRLVTLDVSVRIVFTLIMVGSVYLLYAGHNQPGGGFVGGILAGAAVALRYVAGGIDDVRRISRGRPWTVLGSGLALAAVTAIAPLLWGKAVLSAASWKVHMPVMHTVKLSSVAVFDLGVYLVVFGLALMVFESFGDEPEPVEELEVRA